MLLTIDIINAISASANVIMALIAGAAAIVAWKEYKSNKKEEVVQILDNHREKAIEIAESLLLCGADFWSMAPLFSDYEHIASSADFTVIHESIERARIKRRMLYLHLEAIDELLNDNDKVISEYYEHFSEKKDEINESASFIVASLFVSYFVFIDEENKIDSVDKWKRLVLSEVDNDAEDNATFIDAMNYVIGDSWSNDKLNLSERLYIRCSGDFMKKMLYLHSSFSKV